MADSKLDVAWEKLFNKYDIAGKVEDDGFFEISADEIKEFREPRLMTKFDWSDSRPKLFKDHDLAILPNTRGTYVIGKFKAYKQLDYDELKPIVVRKPDWVRSFDDFPVTSESVALNLAQMTGMIDRVMGTNLDDPEAVGTITGRLKSGHLKYHIDLRNTTTPYMFQVDNSQVEIDAGYENANNLAVIEAKNRIPKDFMIRQLYYPYCSYNNLGTGKEVMPIYFTHADNIYGFHIFEFEEPDNYSSITKVKQLNFIIDEELDLRLDDVLAISKASPNIEDDTVIPFPQADSFTRVLDMLQHLEHPKTRVELAEDYEFDTRQSDYYANALRYLSLATKEDGKFKLTDKGKQLAGLSNSNTRNRLVIQQILNHKTFNLIFEATVKNDGEFDNGYIDKILYETVPTINSMTTAQRRRSTVKSWLDWILNVAVSK
ncbi:hypothetical protein OZX65_00980 [Leuconostocaceae bacterium ESL0723]|nr:hypothetical protein OZX65_00980 [Leuconostocaceae bacterium ESL0723]